MARAGAVLAVAAVAPGERTARSVLRGETRPLLMRSPFSLRPSLSPLGERDPRHPAGTPGIPARPQVPAVLAFPSAAGSDFRPGTLPCPGVLESIGGETGDHTPRTWEKSLLSRYPCLEMRVLEEQLLFCLEFGTSAFTWSLARQQQQVRKFHPNLPLTGEEAAIQRDQTTCLGSQRRQSQDLYPGWCETLNPCVPHPCPDPHVDCRERSGGERQCRASQEEAEMSQPACPCRKNPQSSTCFAWERGWRSKHGGWCQVNSQSSGKQGSALQNSQAFTQHLLGAQGALVDLAMGSHLSLLPFPSGSHGVSMVPASQDG